MVKQDLEIPKSRAEFIRLMVAQGHRRVTRTEVAEYFPRHASLGIFWQRYFPDRERVTIGQLIPYVEYRGAYCDGVPLLVAKILIRRGVIWPGYEVYLHVPPSTKPLPQRYKSKQRKLRW